jgi:hypothetical protein
MLWLAVDLVSEARAIEAAILDPAVSNEARGRALARAQTKREDAERIRIGLQGAQGADS